MYLWRHHVRTIEHNLLYLATIATCLSVLCLSINTDVCCKQRYDNIFWLYYPCETSTWWQRVTELT